MRVRDCDCVYAPRSNQTVIPSGYVSYAVGAAAVVGALGVAGLLLPYRVRAKRENGGRMAGER
jgi:hypothetical protein